MSFNEVAVACIASFLLTVLFTRLLIPFLKSRQLGKTIREDGPAHQAKAGTPTMGGLGMLAAVGVVMVVVLAKWWQSWTKLDEAQPFISYDFYLFDSILLLLTVAMTSAFAVLGLTDDFKGLARKGRSREIGVGFTARHMILLQSAIAVLGLVLMSIFNVSIGWQQPWMFGGTLMGTVVLALVVVGTVNGVNLSDGLDGLAAGLLVLAFFGLGLTMATFLARSDQLGPILMEGQDLVDAGREAARQILVMSVSFVAAAACLGFLVFNHHPAQVFMGNVASMGLGALLAVLAIAGGVWYLLPIIGAVFVVEVLSDIIQIVYFKRTGGKRFFLMAPIHHHFEKLGWPETKIVSVFWSCGLVAALAGIGLAAMLARS